MASIWRRHRSWATPALFILPAVVLFGIVIVLSSLQSLWISLNDWDGMSAMTWVGLGNYRELFSDPQFYVSLKNNLIWLIIFMLAPPLGLGIALLVNQQIKGMRVLKSLFFVPLVLASVAVGVVFTWKVFLAGVKFLFFSVFIWPCLKPFFTSALLYHRQF